MQSLAVQEEEFCRRQSAGGWSGRVGGRCRRRQSRLDDGPFAPVRHDPMAPRIGLHTCTHDAYNNNVIFAKTPPPPHAKVIMSADANCSVPLTHSLLSPLSLCFHLAVSRARAKYIIIVLYYIHSVFIIFDSLCTCKICICSSRTSILPATRARVCVWVGVCGCVGAHRIVNRRRERVGFRF